MFFTVLEFEFTGPNQILEFIFYGKMTGLYKVLLVLVQRTGAHPED